MYLILILKFYLTNASPIQPSWIPPNLKFEVDDMSQTWSYEDVSFPNHHPLIGLTQVGFIRLHPRAQSISVRR
jgi:hypothetical protein